MCTNLHISHTIIVIGLCPGVNIQKKEKGDMEETILTVPEAANYLNVSKRFVYNAIANGTLGHYLIGDGRAIRVGTSHLQKYLKEHEIKINEECNDRSEYETEAQ